MAAYFTTDPSQGKGYGIISIAEITCKEKPSFALYRASDGLCLAKEGWQSAETFLSPTAWDCDSGHLRLAVDAHIVDQLDALETYRIFIKESAQSHKAQTMLVKDIAYSSMHGGQGVGSMPKKIAPIQAPAPEPKPAPEPETIHNPDPLSMESKKEEQAKKSPILLIVLLLFLLALLGFGLWWYLQKNEPESKATAPITQEDIKKADQEPAEEVQKSAKPKESAKDQEPTKPQDKDTAQKPVTSLSAMEQARELLRKEGEGMASWQLAEKLQDPASPQDSDENNTSKQDALFLLTEDAAQKGVSKAMLALAAYYDPTSTINKGSIESDIREAYSWYKKAQEAGEQDAIKALTSLRNFVEKKSLEGDNSAQKLLQTWE